MKIHDITVPIKTGMLHYPGSPAVEVAIGKSMAKGDAGNTSRLTCSVHTGTHVDAPYHYVQDGARIDELDLATLIGPARLFELDVDGEITPAHLARLDLGGVTRALFKTKNSHLMYEPEFTKDYTHFGVAGSEVLVRHGLRLLGIDYISVEGYGDPNSPAHKVLLGSGMIVLEGIDLRAIAPGDYQLICLPLKIARGDGAPARVVLVDENRAVPGFA